MNRDTAAYWEDRLSSDLSLSGTGHAGFSENYNRYMYMLKERSLGRALNCYRIAVEGKEVLDIGCGGGFFVDFYRRKGASTITGVDITDASINAMRERFPAYAFSKLDIGSPRASLSKAFDIVNIFDVLYHIVDDNAFGSAIANIGAWSRKGAWIFITDSLDSSQNAAGHVHYRRPEIYSAALKKEEIDIVDTLPIFHLMGKGVGPAVRNETARKLAARAIESFAWLTYCIDAVYCPAERSTMKLLICRKK
jgi:SAM-dependent methyltransferase